jgi:hypothetical protein
VLAISATTAPIRELPAVDGVQVIVGGRAAGAYVGDLPETVSAVRAFAAYPVS